MKQTFKVLGLVISILLISTMMTSCSADVRPKPQFGSWYMCPSCEGTGYEYYLLDGFISVKCDDCQGCGYQLWMKGPGFRGNNHAHVGDHIPWNECDICGKHVSRW